MFLSIQSAALSGRFSFGYAFPGMNPWAILFTPFGRLKAELQATGRSRTCPYPQPVRRSLPELEVTGRSRTCPYPNLSDVASRSFRRQGEVGHAHTRPVRRSLPELQATGRSRTCLYPDPSDVASRSFRRRGEVGHTHTPTCPT